MPDRRRFGRTPDTICLLAVLTVVGAVLTAAGEVPNSVAEFVPRVVALGWSFLFTASAAITLAGVLWRDHLTGWALELSGRIGLSCSCLAYSIALVGSATVWGTGIVVGMVFALAVSSGWRVWQLVRRFSQFKATVLAYKELRHPRRRRGGHG